MGKKRAGARRRRRQKKKTREATPTDGEGGGPTGSQEQADGVVGLDERYQRWEDAMESAVSSDATTSLVVLEIGCGTRVPSVRAECEAVVRDTLARGGRALLIRVNPDEADGAEDTDASIAAHVIVLKQRALTALRQLEAARLALGGVGLDLDT